MKEDWLNIPTGGDIDVRDIMRQIREKTGAPAQADDSAQGLTQSQRLVQSLWGEMIAPAAGAMAVPITPAECDIYPQGYVIDWHIPILGPLNSIVRRIINHEIRRFLDPALRQQSHINQRFLTSLQQLAQENAQLRYELEALTERINPTDASTSVSSEHR